MPSHSESYYPCRKLKIAEGGACFCLFRWAPYFWKKNLIVILPWTVFPDTELRNIIDKLAQFVARNGPEFEQMTKNKQKDNPKFSFLFGGEYFNYYQYKVTTEQASE